MDRREFLAAAASAPFALRLARARERAVAVALVTADLESRIVAVDLASGRVVRHIPTLAGPRSIETVGGTAVVAHTTEGAVSLVDGRSLRIWRVLHGFEEPRYTAGAPDGRHAYVTDSKLGDVAVVDLARGRVLRRVEVGALARHISIDRSGTRLWVALGFSAQTIVLLDVSDPVKPRVVGRIEPPFHAHDVGFTPDGRSVWVTSGDSRELGVFDASSRVLRLRLPADEPPQHVTFAGASAYVVSGDSATMHVHSLRTGRLLRTTKVPAGSYNVQAAGDRVLTPSLDRGTLCVVDPLGQVVELMRLARSSHDSCVVLSSATGAPL